jgi:hypothetical protein
VPISEAEIETIILGHETRNEALRQTLATRGLDLGEPRTIECHFWAWSQDDASALAEALAASGFRILVQRPAGSPKDPSLWNIEAAIRQSIQLTMRREFTDELVRAAAARSARYDGWGTSL